MFMSEFTWPINAHEVIVKMALMVLSANLVTVLNAKHSGEWLVIG